MKKILVGFESCGCAVIVGENNKEGKEAMKAQGYRPYVYNEVEGMKLFRSSKRHNGVTGGCPELKCRQ